MNTYFIFGYGIPKDILEDNNYRTYLTVCFNTIFDLSKDSKALIVFCGGKTDFFPPYKRSEAREMKRLFARFAKQSFIKKQTKAWKYALSDRTLSTVENVLASRDIYIKNHGTTAVVFCEYTRERRVSILCKKVFENKIKVYPVDFDVSYRRYMSKAELRKKETKDLQIELRALKDKRALQDWHDYKKEYINLVREK